MTSPSPFAALVKDNVLTVTHVNDGICRTLCVARTQQPYSLLLQGHCVNYSRGYGSEMIIRAPDGTDPGQLLTHISEALAEDQRLKIQRQTTLVTLAAVVLVGIATIGCFLASASFSAAGQSTQQPTAVPALSFSPAPKLQTQLPVASLEAQLPVVPRVPVATAIQPQPQPVSDGWPLPASIRAGLPDKLRQAADRQLFTVQYSSGHARTLYVFADPECPNCQRLEPALNAAAGEYNVVVFPVAVIGKEKSIASVAPVLCLPFEQRKAAWDALFDKTGDVMNLGKAKPAAKDAGEQADKAGDCDVARQALGVNEVAYQTYRIPGTPWVIADDGRYVAQAVLQDPALLQAFLQGSEVIDAEQ